MDSDLTRRDPRRTRRHLLDIPHFGMLGTIRPDDTVQVNPMWVDYDEPTHTLRFTHTTYRQKFRNLQHNPCDEPRDLRRQLARLPRDARRS